MDRDHLGFATAALELFGDDKDKRIYRPKLNAVTGDPLASILLQQIVFRWKNNDFSPFYKFNEPCDHPAYRDGDSWLEELGFTRTKLLTARKSIAYKMRVGQPINLNTLTVPVLFWTDASRMTWYNVEPKVLLNWLQIAYANNVASSKIAQAHDGATRFAELMQDSLISNSLISKSGNSDYLMQESCITYTETTTEINNKVIGTPEPIATLSPYMVDAGDMVWQPTAPAMVLDLYNAFKQETALFPRNADDWATNWLPQFEAIIGAATNFDEAVKAQRMAILARRDENKPVFTPNTIFKYAVNLAQKWEHNRNKLGEVSPTVSRQQNILGVM